MSDEERRPQLKRPTIREVATLANASIGTVSRVVNKNPRVRSETVRRVEAVMRDLGFVPDSLAQGFRSGRSGAVACLVPGISNPLFAAHVSGAESVLNREGFSLSLLDSHGDSHREAEALTFIANRRMEGVITSVTSERNADLIKRLRDLGIPVVHLERDLPDFDCVLSDHRENVRRAASYLLSLGHRRVGLITVTLDNWPGRERQGAMCAAYEEHGLDPPHDLMFFEGFSAAYGYATAHRMLLGDDPPTAIIAGANQIVGVLRAIRLFSLAIPEDISVVSIGDLDFADIFSPPLAAVRWDTATIGRVAGEGLLQRLGSGDGNDKPKKRIVLPTEFVVRASCALPPARRPVR